ncbi:response regulator transcription factor [Candidatus Gracilibacteria bacterium 28_42_T64]|nr:response regulator transcription factor [Candidatus Gracilibacteria bacterium 28_42_T64]
MAKILLIEDNREISDSIKQYLELEDFEIDRCFDGESGLDSALGKKYDLILLDVMLPEIDGFTIARKLKERGNEIPIIIITAKDSIDDKLIGFDYGVVDYIVKPFDLRELEARIKTILRKNDDNSVLVVNNIEIDMSKRIFTKDSKDVLITQKEYLIIELLLKNRGTPTSRTDIIEYAWGGGDSIFDSDGKLDVYISNIRHKLSKELIHTIKGFGYKID